MGGGYIIYMIEQGYLTCEGLLLLLPKIFRYPVIIIYCWSYTEERNNSCPKRSLPALRVALGEASKKINNTSWVRIQTSVQRRRASSTHLARISEGNKLLRKDEGASLLTLLIRRFDVRTPFKVHVEDHADHAVDISYS